MSLSKRVPYGIGIATDVLYFFPLRREAEYASFRYATLPDIF